MAEDRVKTAVETVARHIVADASRAALLDSSHLTHELSTEDWQAVCAAVENVAKWGPATENFDAAVEFLASRKAGEHR